MNNVAIDVYVIYRYSVFVVCYYKSLDILYKEKFTNIVLHLSNLTWYTKFKH